MLGKIREALLCTWTPGGVQIGLSDTWFMAMVEVMVLDFGPGNQ